MSEPKDQFVEPEVQTGTLLYLCFMGDDTPMPVYIIEGKDLLVVFDDQLIINFANGKCTNIPKRNLKMFSTEPFTRTVKPKSARKP